jgi:hypothetical protein
MTSFLILIGTLAHAAEPVAKPSASQSAVYAALKGRDDPPTCESLKAASPDLANDLIWLMKHANQPAWVGVRAAYCVLTEYADEKATTIDTWVVDPKRRGLAILTIGMLDKMPSAHAERIAAKALAGPLSADARKHLLESGDPKLITLVD